MKTKNESQIKKKDSFKQKFSSFKVFRYNKISPENKEKLKRKNF